MRVRWICEIFQCVEQSLTNGLRGNIRMYHKLAAENESSVKNRKYPGRFHVGTVVVPQSLEQIILTAISDSTDYKLSHLKPHVEKLRNYIWKRKLPWTDGQIKERANELTARWLAFHGYDAKQLENDSDQVEKIAQRAEGAVKRRLRSIVYHWEPVDYQNQFKCLLYLLAKFDENYAVLLRVFNEIYLRCPDFRPKSLLDFGSGVGTVFWASQQYYSDCISEYFCVDESREMNEISRLLLHQGNLANSPVHRAVNYRQFLSSQQERKYDMVITAHALLDLPSTDARLAAIESLWDKTNDFLVIIEDGTIAGHRAVIEARDFIIFNGNNRKQTRRNETKETDAADDGNENSLASSSADESMDSSEQGYVFAPCPSEIICPRMATKYPCNFLVRYNPMTNLSGKTGVDGMPLGALFSFVVLRKGARPEHKPTWPRLLSDPLVRHKHVWCQLCTTDSSVKNVCVTKAKFGERVYITAKKSNWGDLIPANMKQLESQQTDGSNESMET